MTSFVSNTLLIMIMFIVLVLLFSLVEGDHNSDAELPSEVNKNSHWIDPGDMLGYKFDPEKAEALLVEPNPAVESAFKNLQQELSTCKKQLEALINLHNKCIVESNSATAASSDQPYDTPYFKQLLRNVLERIDVLRTPEIQLQFTPHQLQTLKQYFHSDDGHIQDISTMLNDIISSAKQRDDEGILYSVFDSGIFNILNREFVFVAIIITVSVTIFIVIEMRIKITWRKQILCIIVIGFFMSIPWEWIRLYRKEFAQKQSQVTIQAPQHCITGNISAYESFNMWMKNLFTFSDDECSKYQEALLVDPLWEVTPVQAISVTFTKFFVYPFEYIGGATGKGFRALFKEVPVQWQPFVFIASMIIILFVIILASGAHIWTPLFRISFDRGNNNDEQILQLKNEVTEVLKLCETLVKQGNDPQRGARALQAQMHENKAAAIEDEKPVAEKRAVQETKVESVGST